jgi:hypothetical protein
MKTVWRFLQKLKTHLPYNPAIPFLVINTRDCQSAYNKSTCTTMFISVLFTIAKIWKQPRY